MMDFSKFDAELNMEQLNREIEEAKENGGTGEQLEAPAGRYEGKIENMEIGTTKDGRPMFKLMFRITNGIEAATEEYVSHFKKKKPCLFMNRVLYGTKNDGNMLQSVIGWLEKLESEKQIQFKSYSQFSELVLDLGEEAENLSLEINYNPDSFNNISIESVWEEA